MENESSNTPRASRRERVHPPMVPAYPRPMFVLVQHKVCVPLCDFCATTCSGIRPGTYVVAIGASGDIVEDVFSRICRCHVAAPIVVNPRDVREPGPTRPCLLGSPRRLTNLWPLGSHCDVQDPTTATGKSGKKRYLTSNQKTCSGGFQKVNGK